MTSHSETANVNLPWRSGNTGPDQRMILDANGNYVCSVQIVQMGGGAIASAMEGARHRNADFILEAANAYHNLAEQSEPHEVFWMQPADDGQSIRKWSRTPFEGGRKCRVEIAA